MGLTKQYLRYAADGIFGIVASKNCNAAFIDKKPVRYVVTGGAHCVIIWDTRFQRKVKVFKCDSPAVVVQPSTSGNKVAVGHLNGIVSIYNTEDLSSDVTDPEITFEGHTAEITCLAWDGTESRVASGSKDTKVVLWDIISETGIYKFREHKGMISRVQFWNNDEFLVSSSFDSTLRIWDLDTKLNVHTIPCTIQIRDFSLCAGLLVVAEAHLKVFKVSYKEHEWITEELGTLLRRGKDRPNQMMYLDNPGVLFVVGVKSPEIEAFQLYSEERCELKRKKRLKKNPTDSPAFILRDLVRRLESIKASEPKVKSINGVSDKKGVKIVCCLPSNQLQIFSGETANNPEITPNLVSHCVPFDGHRKLVRGVAFSSDNTAILTASADSFKLWNRDKLTCVLTIPHDYNVVCCTFCPGDRHFIAGTTDGNIILGDVSCGVITQVEANGNENVWGLQVYPNNTGFVASNGKFVQFYDFSISDGKLLFNIVKQLDVQESVLCLKVSPNMKFIAVGLMDSTIKIFYLDTLKFHLSMYGHALPVVGIDISSDNSLLVSCSGDKTVKVWGLDFGDCHCSLIHSDGLVGCAFLYKTHLISSMAKETLNIYDADSHERIQTVKAHTASGSTCMANSGFYIASSGRDQTIRIFKRTEEILVLSDEREQEREEELDNEARKEEPELVGLETAAGEKWADKLIEALETYKNPNQNDLLLSAFQAKDETEFLYKTLISIKPSELLQSIMLLPVCYTQDLVVGLLAIAKTYPLSTELVVRCLCGIMKFSMVNLNTIDRNVLTSLSNLLKTRVFNTRQMVHVNQIILENMYEQQCSAEHEQTFREILGDKKKKRRRRDRKKKTALLIHQ